MCSNCDMIREERAENARLQARVMELGRGVAELLVERDGYKALAERRGEALEFWLTKAGHDGCLTGRICRNLKCAEARAALAATPELTNC